MCRDGRGGMQARRGSSTRLLGWELPLTSANCSCFVRGLTFLPPAIATFLLVGCRKARWLRCIAAMPRRS
jgi:hypothetical protein